MKNNKIKLHQVWEKSDGIRFIVTGINEFDNFFYCKDFNGHCFGSGSAWFDEYKLIG